MAPYGACAAGKGPLIPDHGRSGDRVQVYGKPLWNHDPPVVDAYRMQRIQLTRVTVADAADLISANRANQAYHAPWVTPFTDRDGFERWFARSLAGATVSLVARDRASGKIAGVVNLNDIVAGALQSAYLGFYGMAEFGRTGRMGEALRQAVSVAFDELGLHRVEANIQPGNLASIGLVRRLGFSKEGFSPRYLRIGGQWRDHERWALVADVPVHAPQA